MEQTIRIHKLINGTDVEGPGHRLVFWVQGCSLHCEGCFEQDTWNPNDGYDISINELLKMLKNDVVEGVTVLGGEPFDQAKSLAFFLEEVKGLGKNSIVFSGYTYDWLKQSNSSSVKKALDNIDLLIDGDFKKDLLEDERPLVGSRNQQFIALSDKGIELINEMKLFQNKVEVRINNKGVVMINGMWKKGILKI